MIEKYKLRDAGVKGGGYDTLPKTLELLQAGQLDFTIDQQPYMQGFVPGHAAVHDQAVGRPQRAPATSTPA